MGVYIKGMAMPTSPVLFCIHPDGKVFADLEGNWREYKAVPVPPHGRLIDADELVRNGGEYNHPLIDIDGAWDDTIPVISVDTIENAPTIIPASGGNEDE